VDKKEKLNIQLRPENYSKIKEAIMRGITECICTHGPIDKQNIGSATKRAYGNVKAVLRDL
jgi:hemoglobin-like flavoprotein